LSLNLVSQFNFFSTGFAKRCMPQSLFCGAAAGGHAGQTAIQIDPHLMFSVHAPSLIAQRGASRASTLMIR
jgi:hypothetical protein